MHTGTITNVLHFSSGVSCQIKSKLKEVTKSIIWSKSIIQISSQSRSPVCDKKRTMENEDTNESKIIYLANVGRENPNIGCSHLSRMSGTTRMLAMWLK